MTSHGVFCYMFDLSLVSWCFMLLMFDLSLVSCFLLHMFDLALKLVMVFSVTHVWPLFSVMVSVTHD